ncbi:HAD family hydrolase [Arcobacter sp. LA11]|uniref:HAD family hydrolase n=1 Tax=Arcobacter sp. LA11 TaxID=1898176 RepID=UPI0009327F40|nr:HAD-IA family hydrolase [Arcobacter sp. LA11]
MIKNIIFDFDGVILDSMPTRDYGFREIFKEFDNNLVEKLIDYHNINGGLSRFVKIRYFYEELLNKNISDNEVQLLANSFSKIMKNELIKKKYLITNTVEFIINNHIKYNLHIASGSEHNELNYLCEKLELKDFFLTINGSPIKKNIIVENIINHNNYLKNETILIGDSINDYEAAQANQIKFYGFNNLELKRLDSYINDFGEVVFD